MSYLEQSARFVVRNTLDFGNHKDASIVEDNIDVTESHFGFGKRSLDLVWLSHIKLYDKQLVGRVARLEVGDCIRCAESCHDLVSVLE